MAPRSCACNTAFTEACSVSYDQAFVRLFGHCGQAQCTTSSIWQKQIYLWHCAGYRFPSLSSLLPLNLSTRMKKFILSTSIHDSKGETRFYDLADAGRGRWHHVHASAIQHSQRLARCHMIKLLFAYLVIAVRHNVLPARSGKNKYIYGTVPAAVSHQFHPCAPRISAQGWKRSPLAPPCTPARVKPVSMILQMSVVEGGIPFIWAYPTYQHSIFMNYLPISAVFLWITYLSAQRICELPTYLRSAFMNYPSICAAFLWITTKTRWWACDKKQRDLPTLYIVAETLAMTLFVGRTAENRKRESTCMRLRPSTPWNIGISVFKIVQNSSEKV